jgi:hypothetical protein
VLKSWMSDNNIDKEDIALYRYTTQWDKLSTSLRYEDAGAVYYQASPPGMSLFAIGGEPAGALPCNNNNICETNLGENEANCADCQMGVICVPDELRCSGKALQRCNQEGTGWDTIETCEVGCFNKQCVAQVFEFPEEDTTTLIIILSIFGTLLALAISYRERLGTAASYIKKFKPDIKKAFRYEFRLPKERTSWQSVQSKYKGEKQEPKLVAETSKEVDWDYIKKKYGKSEE